MVIQTGEEKQEHTQVLRGSEMCLHPRERRLEFFTITEIGLHKRVFIITLDITKLQKYPYDLNILYYIVGASPLNPNLLFCSPNKEDMLEGQCRCFTPVPAPFYSQNEPHAITDK